MLNRKIKKGLKGKKIFPGGFSSFDLMQGNDLSLSGFE
jgi:hypothetical protein